MKKSLITREKILDTAKEITYSNGITNLNIRDVAIKSDIAVGTIYNYYPSKDDLLFAVIEDFWKNAFHNNLFDFKDYDKFSDFIEGAYKNFYEYFKKFKYNFLNEISKLSAQTKSKGREIEEKYWHHIREGMLIVLDGDKYIKDGIWKDNFTKLEFMKFVFSNMITLLKNDSDNCDFLIMVIEKILYD